MSQNVENVNYTEDRGERIERVVEIYDSADAVRDHNPETKKKDNSMKTPHTGEEQKVSRCYPVTVVCVVLLCVFLLGSITVLWIKFNILNTANNQLETKYNNLTTERDQLQTRYNNLTVQRDQIQTRYNNLTEERKRLETKYNNLTTENNQLQTKYNNLNVEINQLQTNNSNLINQRNQLQTKNDRLLRMLIGMDEKIIAIVIQYS
ncbi:CD209 molecule [Silurus meridionalis]|nr:CD209 molecule [Silurus meridionalis]